MPCTNMGGNSVSWLYSINRETKPKLYVVLKSKLK